MLLPCHMTCFNADQALQAREIDAILTLCYVSCVLWLPKDSDAMLLAESEKLEGHMTPVAIADQHAEMLR